MEIRTVLCPIDFSSLDDRELDLAVQVCEAFRARLVLHHNVSAVSPGFAKAWEWDQTHRESGVSVEAAHRRLATLLRQLPARIQAESVVTDGPLAMVVLTLAHEVHADFLVLGTHGWSTEDHASVTERVIARAPCPVLTIRDVAGLRRFRLTAQPGDHASRLVVPTDFSPTAGTILRYATELARELDLQLHLLHIAHSARAFAAKQALHALVPADLRERTQCHVRVGRIDEEIERFLLEIEPELVVMGTHARDFWRRLFTRDVARELLHRATCPVCFVPPSAAQ
jgi:nucleotide-binding universal stress UspA family protein